MSRWKKEGIVYSRTRNWKFLSEVDEYIDTQTNCGVTRVHLNYEDGTIQFLHVSEGEDIIPIPIAYFPIEEMEEIVGHMKNTIKMRRKVFEEKNND